MKRSFLQNGFTVFIVVLLFTVLLNDGQSVAAEPVSSNPTSNDLEQAGTGALFYHIPGSALIPTHSDTKIVTDYMGCFHLSAGSSYSLNAILDIPNGSRIVQLRLFYHDIYGSIDSWIYRFNDLGNSQELIAYVGSVANPGYTSNYTNIDHTVDNFNYSYVLMVRFNGMNEDIQVCGLRVTYWPPS